ncbi:MAG: Gfo/Idh/MocA family oxidoreductase, partial [Candidatus Sumerlaeota bacterium]
WEWNNPFTVICENLTVRFTDANTAEFIYTGGEETRRENIEADTDMYAAEIQDFVALLRGEKNQAPTVEEGLLGLRIVSAVLQSSDDKATPIQL